MSMADTIERWSVGEVRSFIAEELEEIAEKFEGEEIDGETLLMLVRGGSSHQYHACGLQSIKSQLQLKKIVDSACSSPTPSSASKGDGENELGVQVEDRKFSREEMKKLFPEERQIYLIKRNRVNAAVKTEWPGNSIPVFRGAKNVDNVKRLDEVVNSLVASCCCYTPPSLPKVVFGMRAIKQHCLDSLNERRRRVHVGHDYENPAKKIKIEKQDQAKAEEAQEIETSKKADHDQGLEIEMEKDQDHAQGSEIGMEDQDQELSETKDPAEEEQTKDVKSDYAESEESEESEGDGSDVSSDDFDKLHALSEEITSSKSAAVVVIVGFEAHQLKEISRSQLVSAVHSLFHPADPVKQQLKKADKVHWSYQLHELLYNSKSLK